MDKAPLATWDIVTIVLYFVIVIAVGIAATALKSKASTKGFFLAGKSMTFLPIAGSIFATNIGASTFVGLSGSAAATGFAPVLFEWHATYILMLLGWIFVPIYVATGSFTMPDYLQKRFGGRRLRIYFAVMSLVLIVLSGISAQMYAGSLFIQQLLGWNIYAACAIILTITAAYTIAGGLAAVIYTDAVQTVILLIGAVVVTFMGMYEVGGYQEMLAKFMNSSPNVTSPNVTMWTNGSVSNLSRCGQPPDDAFHILRGVDSAYPWPGMIFGLTIIATNFFCTNQVIVQRNLAAKNVAHSKAACVVTSYLKILPFFLFVWPGMISRILYPDEIACGDPESCSEICGNPSGCTNIAYPLLVLRLLPTGLRGLMLAALLAALMSSLTSYFNSASSLFTMDLWKLYRPQASDRELVHVGRLFGLVMIIVSFAWLPILQAIQGGVLWDYIQSIYAYVVPPWVVIFFLGIFWSRCTEQAAFWGLMSGLAVGVIRMGIQFSYPVPGCGEEDFRPSVLTKVHYLHFALILAAASAMVAVPVSLFTKPRKKEQLHRVTWWTRHDEEWPALTDDEDSDTEEEVKETLKPNHIEEFQTDHCDQTKIVKPAGKFESWFCGSTQDVELSKEEKRKELLKMTSIKENKFWSRVCDVNAVIAVAITCAIIGYYH